MTIITTHYRYKRPPRWWCSRFVVCGVISIAVFAPTWGAENKFDGVYTGKRVLTKGSNQTCPSEDDVSVTIHGDTLTFTNNQFRDFALSFQPHPDGSFGQIHADIGGSAVLMRGRLVGDILDADVTNFRCEYHWHLKKGL